MASFFSPCSFPLLVTLLARETGAEREEERSVLPRALRFATALSIGAALFLLLAGAAIALGGAPLFEGVTFTSAAGRTIRIIIGSLLILFGLMQLGVIPVPFEAVAELAFPLERRQAQLRRRHPTAGFALFGFAYILAGFGWTGPILAGLAGHAFTVGGALAAFISFVVAAIIMALLMFILSLAIAFAQEQFVGVLRASTTRVKQYGGRILILVGVWLVVLAIWADFYARYFPVWF